MPPSPLSLPDPSRHSRLFGAAETADAIGAVLDAHEHHRRHDDQATEPIGRVSKLAGSTAHAIARISDELGMGGANRDRFVRLVAGEIDSAMREAKLDREATIGTFGVVMAVYTLAVGTLAWMWAHNAIR